MAILQEKNYQFDACTHIRQIWRFSGVAPTASIKVNELLVGHGVLKTNLKLVKVSQITDFVTVGQIPCSCGKNKVPYSCEYIQM